MLTEQNIILPLDSASSRAARAAIYSILDSEFSGSVIALVAKSESADLKLSSHDSRLKTIPYELPLSAHRFHSSLKRLLAVNSLLAQCEKVEGTASLVLDPNQCKLQANPQRFLLNTNQLTFFEARNGNTLGMDVTLRWMCLRLFGEDYFWSAAREQRLTPAVLLGPTPLLVHYYAAATAILIALEKTPSLSRYLCHDLGVLIHHRIRSSFDKASTHLVENGSAAVLDLEFFESQDIGFAEHGTIITASNVAPAIICGLHKHPFLTNMYLGNRAATQATLQSNL